MNPISATSFKTDLFDISLPKNKCLIFDVREQDPITNKTFAELIQAQVEKNLPYILAVTKHDDNYPHFFDALNLRKWCCEHSLNNQDFKLNRIFFFTIMLTDHQRDSFQYLGHSKETDDRNDFIFTFFEAAENNIEAMYKLGDYYDEGLLVDYNRKEAKKWWKLALNQSNFINKKALKKVYKKHQIDPQDLIQRLEIVQRQQFFEEAKNNASKYYDDDWSSEKKNKVLKLLHEACNGNPEAQFAIGKYHLKTINPNGNLTVKWWKLAALSHHIKAQFQLSICYEKGICVSKNPDKAFNYCLDAATQGHIDALFNLGNYYSEGIGVVQNMSTAIKLWSLVLEIRENLELTSC